MGAPKRGDTRAAAVAWQRAPDLSPRSAAAAPPGPAVPREPRRQREAVLPSAPGRHSRSGGPASAAPRSESRRDPRGQGTLAQKGPSRKPHTPNRSSPGDPLCTRSSRLPRSSGPQRRRPRTAPPAAANQPPLRGVPHPSASRSRHDRAASRPRANPKSTGRPLYGRAEGAAIAAASAEPPGKRPRRRRRPRAPGYTRRRREGRSLGSPAAPRDSRRGPPGTAAPRPRARLPIGAPVPHALQLGGGGREGGRGAQLGSRLQPTSPAPRLAGCAARRPGPEGERRGAAGGPQAPPRPQGAALPGCRRRCRRHFPRAAARPSPARREEPSRRSLRLGPPPPAGPAPSAPEALCTRPGTVPGAPPSDSAAHAVALRDPKVALGLPFEQEGALPGALPTQVLP
ncbi:basic salivary proline-rich protein 2-like [Pituophis catenifer annectens]|uniref:basic salivary proline-rich protein 2-like n=1 Tax=Pituophis catenifer annectens TaxID=94852 RepID=UPI003995E036